LHLANTTRREKRETETENARKIERETETRKERSRPSHFSNSNSSLSQACNYFLRECTNNERYLPVDGLLHRQLQPRII
jgi:hypothetical protein